ncbi:hypothetical protein JCM33374_g1093 [Metschnikowia sp. JCM 33374]|nr:hypothetical protein JCM33374_g1093 [Metschnikowia sp. JCM 33374]
MSSEYRLETSVEPKNLKRVIALAGTEWSGKLTPEEFAEIHSKQLVDFILKGNPGRAFYFESKSGDILATCIITQHKALYKEAGVSTIGTMPDPSSFGVNNITAIRLSYVFVAKEARGKGLMGSLIPQAIEYTEAEILKKELAKSSDKKDSFRSMVQDGNSIDQTLVRHYLGKKYVWYLYSAIDSAYAKFGFKAYPLEGYKLDWRLSSGEMNSLVKKLLSSDGSKEIGKKLRLLDGTKASDRQLIDQIIQGKSLEILTDLNKNVYHSELQGDSHSSSSFTSLSSALSASRRGSARDLSFAAEKDSSSGSKQEASSATVEFNEVCFGSSGKSASVGSITDAAEIQQRRKSSILSLGCPKFAILPEVSELDRNFAGTKETAEKVGTEVNRNYSSVYGAILTNELQKKSFYILWMLIKGIDFTIVAMGELRFDLFGMMADPLGTSSAPGRRRSSSFTGINDMGGFNFQDLDLLVSTAVHVAHNTALFPEAGSVFVNLNDLPTTIPKPVLHDFFLNYLPKAYDPRDANTTPDEPSEEQARLVTYMKNFSDNQVLPMLRKYGSNDGNFELDWVANSLITWG